MTRDLHVGTPAGAQKVDDVCRALRAAIDDGRYPPGAALRETQISEDLGVARTPVRDALRQLQRAGVVTLIPNRGVVVRTLSVQELDEIYTLRAVIEGFCASRAATRMDAGAIHQLGEIEQELERVADGTSDEAVDRLIRLNRSFHGMIVDHCGNRRAPGMLTRVVDVPLSLQRSFWQLAAARHITTVYHREIVAAIGARDSVRAEAVMRSHVYAVKDHFGSQIRTAGIQDLIGAQER